MTTTTIMQNVRDRRVEAYDFRVRLYAEEKIALRSEIGSSVVTLAKLRRLAKDAGVDVVDAEDALAEAGIQIKRPRPKHIARVDIEQLQW